MITQDVPMLALRLLHSVNLQSYHAGTFTFLNNPILVKHTIQFTLNCSGFAGEFSAQQLKLWLPI